jgi:hypothetical protein
MITAFCDLRPPVGIIAIFFDDRIVPIPDVFEFGVELDGVEDVDGYFVPAFGDGPCDPGVIQSAYYRIALPLDHVDDRKSQKVTFGILADRIIIVGHGYCPKTLWIIVLGLPSIVGGSG